MIQTIYTSKHDPDWRIWKEGDSFFAFGTVEQANSPYGFPVSQCFDSMLEMKAGVITLA